MKLAALSALLGSAAAFPALLNLNNGDKPLLDLSDVSVLDLNQQRAKESKKYPAADSKNCPYNPNHEPAAPWNASFPYNYAKNGLPGKGKGGFQVPAPGDEAHRFIAPRDGLDIRGPCPGMNLLANHGFIARDGITDLAEVTDALQNVFNVGFDLSVVITLVALTLGDGDVVSRKFSIGCDATSRTAAVQLLAGSQPGLNGHNNFEADASMCRDDYYLNAGDNYNLNGTKFGHLVAATEGRFNISGLSRYRLQRWHESQAENPNFFFGPAGLLLYGDAAFLPELYASGSKDYEPDVETISTFMGAHQNPHTGKWAYGRNETFPANYINRVQPYGVKDELNAILSMYLENPVLFGGNTAPGKFDTLDFGAIKKGKIEAGISMQEMLCFLFQLLTAPMPGLLNGVAKPVSGALELVLSTVTDSLTDLGCPAALNSN